MISASFALLDNTDIRLLEALGNPFRRRLDDLHRGQPDVVGKDGHLFMQAKPWRGLRDVRGRDYFAAGIDIGFKEAHLIAEPSARIASCSGGFQSSAMRKLS